MGDISQIKLPDNTTYDLKDNNAYHPSDTSQSAYTALNDGDYVPTYTTGSAKKKFTLKNLYDWIFSKLPNVSKDTKGIAPQGAAVSSQSQTTKFLREDGQWAAPSYTSQYSLPLAADGTRGGVQIGYTQSGKNYPVELSDEKMYVNVPWTDVGDGTLTITQNGTSKGTFTANQSTASTIDIDVHNGVATANNLTPTEDTPAAWVSLLGSPSSTNYYVTYYNTASKFTNQPSTYGILETFLYNAIIYQRWKPLTTGNVRYRVGNNTGWNGSATASGEFTQIVPTDENVKITSTNPASTTTYYPTWVDSSGTKGENINNGFAYLSRNGTTSQDGVAVVQAGNSIASGTANNKKGYFRVYNKNSNYATIGYNDSATSDTAHTLPATGGTIVNNNTFRSQATVTTTENGLMIATDKSKLDNLDNTKDVNKNVNSATKLTKTETVLQTNQVPYVSRASLSPEGFSGYIREKLVGGSVAWNQNIYNGNFVDTSKWVFASSSTVSASNNVLTLTANTAGSLLYAYPDTAYRKTWQVGHKILATLDAKTSTSGLAISASLAYGTVTKNKIKINFSLTSSWQTISNIVNITEATEGIRIAHANSSTVAVGDAYQVRNVYVVDLTVLFGSAIADYIYSLESSTAGAGVSLLRSLGLFTKPYYVQDNGSIQSVCVKEKKIVGLNQWDEEWELGNYNASGQPIVATDRIRTKNYIPVLSNTNYYFYCTTASVGGLFYFYDANKEYILSVEKGRNTVFTTPQNACYLRFRMYSNYGTVYKNDICINISDISKNGTYEPYHLDTIPLSATELRGIPKLDSNNNPYFDGDEYESSGKITRKYGIVDLGTLTWLYNSTYKVFYCSDDLGEARKTGVTTICSKYLSVANTTDISTIQNGTCCVYSNSGVNVHRLYVKDEMYTTTSAFETAMSGVYFVYELATPTEETVLSYQNPQYAKGGTEEFVDYYVQEYDPEEPEDYRPFPIPCGHVTEYMGATSGEYQTVPTLPVDSGQYSLVTDGQVVNWVKPYVTAGQKTGTTLGKYATAEGNSTISSGYTSHAEGAGTTASGFTSHAEGNNTTASGFCAHTEGLNSVASGDYSHAEGLSTASGNFSHAEGRLTVASADYSHTEGAETTTTKPYAHAEGYQTKANGYYSHAEGWKTETSSSAPASHAEGYGTKANGYNSHAEGSNTIANGNDSHSEGSGTIATASCSHAGGRYNVEDTSGNYAFIIGNGNSDNLRSNALTLDWNGNLKATSYSNFSSKKYKENISEMTDEEAMKILQLNPVKYDYKSEFLPNNQYGLIAEDVEKIMTYPIVYENNEADSIDYSKFVPALIKMIQIQQKQIDELMNR